MTQRFYSPHVSDLLVVRRKPLARLCRQILFDRGLCDEEGRTRVGKDAVSTGHQ